MLEMLDLSSNSLKGTFTSSHMSDLSRLRQLSLSSNSALKVNVSDDWIPPFQLELITFSSCKLGPHFPRWLQTQKNFSFLDISNAGISDTIPTSFWDSLSTNMWTIDMSRNMIHGVLPNLTTTFHKTFQLNLSSNLLEGSVPAFLGGASALFLSDNLFTDLITFLCSKSEAKMNLSFLDLSNNLFSGELPDCWMHFDQLSVLLLENINFSGDLPASIGALRQLQALKLRNNSFSGKLPMSLENCTSLIILDLSYNLFTGSIPYSMGHRFNNLGVLMLQSNKFLGDLPSSICQLSHLQILDLSINHISGVIPKCIYKLTGMINSTNVITEIMFQFGYTTNFLDTEWVMWKRKEQSFKSSLGQVKGIDVSNNELQGDIPEGVSTLAGLVFLNLSRNHLVGSITQKIGQLRSLEFLDLSNNHFSGEIPMSLTDVSSLEILDLSNNNLSGKIPVSTQLQSFDASAYTGNHGLCGAPLERCPGDEAPTTTTTTTTPHEDTIPQHEDVHDDIFPGLYISIVFGFIIGFWGVCGTLVLKRSWRIAFFSCMTV